MWHEGARTLLLWEVSAAHPSLEGVAGCAEGVGRGPRRPRSLLRGAGCMG